MGDCIWGFIFCEGDCANCKKYMSVNASEKGNELFEQYQNEIEQAIKPVKEKYEKLFNESEDK